MRNGTAAPASSMLDNLIWHDDVERQHGELLSNGAWRLAVKWRVALPDCALFVATSQVNRELTPQLFCDTPIAWGPRKLAAATFDKIVELTAPLSPLPGEISHLVRVSLAIAGKLPCHGERWLAKYLEGLQGLEKADERQVATLVGRLMRRQEAREVLGPMYPIGIDDERFA